MGGVFTHGLVRTKGSGLRRRLLSVTSIVEWWAQPTRHLRHQHNSDSRIGSFVRRREFRDTPQHGRGLNMAENELRSLTRPCLNGRRIGDLQTLREEMTAWHTASNHKQRGVEGQFQIDAARLKLKSLYPKSLA